MSTLRAHPAGVLHRPSGHRQRQASLHTIAAYRDATGCCWSSPAEQTAKPASRLDTADLDAPLIGAFLNHLEAGRGNSARNRNARLAAVHSLFRYAALHHPEDAAVIPRVLAIPPKRYDRGLVSYLTQQEITALLAAPDQAAWTGRRHHALLMLACQTGLRATELIGLTTGDAHLGTGAHVSCPGKGRKQRITPLTSRHHGRTWPPAGGTRRPARPPAVPDPPRRPAEPDGLQRRIAKYGSTAAQACPGTAQKRFHPTSCVTQPQCGCSTPG